MRLKNYLAKTFIESIQTRKVSQKFVSYVIKRKTQSVTKRKKTRYWPRRNDTIDGRKSVKMKKAVYSKEVKSNGRYVSESTPEN